MRNDYITRRYVKERLEELLSMCKDRKMNLFIKDRLAILSMATTTECRRYLYFDTLEALQNPHRWESKQVEGGRGTVDLKMEPRIYV